MARITVEDCIDKFPNRFELVLVSSNRARKLHSGETPLVEKDNDKNTVIALREIADEHLSIEELKNNLIEEYQTVPLNDDEDLSLEYSDDEKNNDIEDIKEEEVELKEEEVVEIKEEEVELKEEDHFPEEEINSEDEIIENVNIENTDINSPENTSNEEEVKDSS